MENEVFILILRYKGLKRATKKYLGHKGNCSFSWREKRSRNAFLKQWLLKCILKDELEKGFFFVLQMTSQKTKDMLYAGCGSGIGFMVICYENGTLCNYSKKLELYFLISHRGF